MASARGKSAVGSKKGPTAVGRSAVLSTGAARDVGFPIVGMGASAGGLEAFEQFFRHVPASSGIAFVLVSHLDPDRASLLKQILQRDTAMPVVEATHQMVLAPDRVHVVPPNRHMAIFHGALQLSVPDVPRGQRMPIDAFLRSLAEDQEDRAIGVILSGTGTDGTLGLRAIHGAGGVCFVQDPATAQYDGMPLSAIRAGHVTNILPVEKMPEQLLLAVRNRGVSRERPAPTAAAANHLNRILMLLRSSTGHDFSLYKRNTIVRRIERRMAAHDIADTEIYARYMKEHPEEVRLLFKELLINVTSFFRDPGAFATLEREVLPPLLAEKPNDYVFRVWVAGCSTGEEAYSIAILLREHMSKTRQSFKVQIYGTDIDGDAIATARAGSYPPNIAQDVAPERLGRFFVKEETGYRVKKDIREMLVFATQNVIKDPPFTRLDLLSCRNLLIYLAPDTQDRLLQIFHYALSPLGALFLSPSESIGTFSDLFAPLNRKWKLYRAIHSIASTRGVVAGRLAWSTDRAARTQAGELKTTREAKFAEIAKRVLLQSFAPASVVTDMKGNILYVHGDTGPYLRPAPGQATLNVVEMARESLQLELRAALHAAAGQRTAASRRELAVKTNGGSQHVNLTVRPLSDPEAGQGLLLVSFQSVASRPAATKRSSKGGDARRAQMLASELASTRENLQATIEAEQASNEELQSTNEELQSTNEELETSREELQSVNEELVTVNAEFQGRIEQLAAMQNDMKNLLDNINVGIIFLDEQLVIKRFTREAARIYHLVQTDLGRPLDDIKANIEGEDLTAETRTVLESLVPREREVRTASGASYLARIIPYRTLDNVIDGVVLTFADISLRIAAEQAVHEAGELAENIINTVREPLVVLDGDFKVISASGSFYRSFQVAPRETVGQSLFRLGGGHWDNLRLREALESILPGNSSFDDVEIDQHFPGLGRRKMVLNARRILRPTGETQLILLAIEDVTERQREGRGV
jgi:two-component system CheB/CheR fusion protein